MRSTYTLLLAFLGLAGAAVVPTSPASATELTVRVRMADGSVRRVQAEPTDTVEAVCEKLGDEAEEAAGVSLEGAPDEPVEVEATLRELKVGHGGWLYLLRDPEAAGADTRATVQRMRMARERALKGGGVTEIKSLKHLEQELSAAKGMLVVVDFYADWCGPCKQIAPAYKAMAGEFPRAVFLKVNVDKNQQVSQKYGVKSMPTFKLIKRGKVIDTVVGGNESSLRDAVSRSA